MSGAAHNICILPANTLLPILITAESKCNELYCFRRPRTNESSLRQGARDCALRDQMNEAEENYNCESELCFDLVEAREKRKGSFGKETLRFILHKIKLGHYWQTDKQARHIIVYFFQITKFIEKQ